jgi:hypothetical protein
MTLEDFWVVTLCVVGGGAGLWSSLSGLSTISGDGSFVVATAVMLGVFLVCIGASGLISVRDKDWDSSTSVF